MPVITFVTNNNKQVEVEGEPNLLRTSIRYKGGIPYKCGGGICGTCHCTIEEGWDNLDEVKRHEYRRLGEDLIEQGHRLACQTFVKGDVKVSWEEKKSRRQKKQVNVVGKNSG